jgi:hypothetical protein
MKLLIRATLDSKNLQAIENSITKLKLTGPPAFSWVVLIMKDIGIWGNANEARHQEWVSAIAKRIGLKLND